MTATVLDRPEVAVSAGFQGFTDLAERAGLDLEPFQRRIAKAALSDERELLVLLPRGNGKAVNRRVYRGQLDLPKSNRPRRIALTPPARDALLGQPTRQDGDLVFRSKRGCRLSQPTLSGYWGKVLARARLDFDFYLATKHYAVHYLHATLGLPPRVIAEQMGWTMAGVLKLLAVSGHGDIGALEEVDRAFRDTCAHCGPSTQTQLRRKRVPERLSKAKLIQSPRLGESRSGSGLSPSWRRCDWPAARLL